MRNKRGAAMAINTIILLVIGIAVLVMLILGFTMGFSKVLPFLSSENVQSIVEGCRTACLTSAKYAYCTQNRTLIDESENPYIGSCLQFTTNDSLKVFGIEECPSITCP